MKKFNLKNLKLEDRDVFQRQQLTTIFGGAEKEQTPGCPGYSGGKWSFNSGNGNSGCACVSEADSLWGAGQNNSSNYYDSRCES